MANFIFNHAKRLIMSQSAGSTAPAQYLDLETNSSGQILTTTADYLRCLLVTEQLTLATHGDFANMDLLEAHAGFTERAASGGYTASGGAAGQIKSATWALAGTGATAFAYLKADDIAWGAINADTTNTIAGCVVWYGDANASDPTDTNDIPVAYLDFTAAPDGSNLTMQWGAATGATTSGAQGVVLRLNG